MAEQFWLLGECPQLGRRRDHDLRLGHRSFPVGEYLIIYRTEASQAHILHIFHGSRDFSANLFE